MVAALVLVLVCGASFVASACVLSADPCATLPWRLWAGLLLAAVGLLALLGALGVVIYLLGRAA